MIENGTQVRTFRCTINQDIKSLNKFHEDSVVSFLALFFFPALATASRSLFLFSRVCLLDHNVSPRRRGPHLLTV